jgi:hypothetical protein
MNGFGPTAQRNLAVAIVACSTRSRPLHTASSVCRESLVVLDSLSGFGGQWEPSSHFRGTRGRSVYASQPLCVFLSMPPKGSIDADCVCCAFHRHWSEPFSGGPSYPRAPVAPIGECLGSYLWRPLLPEVLRTCLAPAAPPASIVKPGVPVRRAGRCCSENHSRCYATMQGRIMALNRAEVMRRGVRRNGQVSSF